MNRMLFLLLGCFASVAQAQDGGGITNLLRSVTGAISGAPTPPPAQQTTTVLGVRGMDEETALASNAVVEPAQALKQLDAWAVGRGEAEKAAAKRGLAARKVVYAAAAKETK